MYFIGIPVIRSRRMESSHLARLQHDLTAVRPAGCDSSMDVAQVGLSLSLFLSFLITVPHLILSLNVHPGSLFVLEVGGGKRYRSSLSAEGLK